MKTIIEEAIANLNPGTPFVLATVIRTWGSAPRKAGSHMLITRVSMSGSVSGGCVENDVFKQALLAMDEKQGRLIHYGVSDEDAWNVGLSCGGMIDVLLEVFSPIAEDRNYWEEIQGAIDRNTGIVVFHELTGNDNTRLVVHPNTSVSDAFTQHAKTAFDQRSHLIAEFADSKWFIEVVNPRHTLLIFGAAHIAAELTSLAKQFDFETLVIDPRSFFTDGTVFSVKPDQFFVGWPAEVLPEIQLTPYTYAVTLTHDPKIDDQALEILLRSSVAYLGALGSRKTHEKRIHRLQQLGFTEDELKRIHAPVGIDIKAQSAKEIALSIMADLIREKNKYIQ